ncbi:MAG: hypothetical protein MJY63_01425 [Paludibacteraceae bacterium]|nr:hypothetical protein [Paludibacteraceae bacterium]
MDNSKATQIVMSMAGDLPFDQIPSILKDVEKIDNEKMSLVYIAYSRLKKYRTAFILTFFLFGGRAYIGEAWKTVAWWALFIIGLMLTFRLSSLFLVFLFFNFIWWIMDLILIPGDTKRINVMILRQSFVSLSLIPKPENSLYQSKELIMSAEKKDESYNSNVFSVDEKDVFLSIPMKRSTRMFIAPLLWCIFWGILYVVTTYKNHGIGESIIFCIFLIVIIFLSMKFLLPLIRKGKDIVSIEDNGIRVVELNKNTFVPWQNITGIERTKILLFMETWFIHTNNIDDDINSSSFFSRLQKKNFSFLYNAIYMVQPYKWQGDFHSFCEECKKHKSEIGVRE